MHISGLVIAVIRVSLLTLNCNIIFTFKSCYAKLVCITVSTHITTLVFEHLFLKADLIWQQLLHCLYHLFDSFVCCFVLVVAQWIHHRHFWWTIFSAMNFNIGQISNNSLCSTPLPIWFAVRWGLGLVNSKRYLDIRHSRFKNDLHQITQELFSRSLYFMYCMYDIPKFVVWGSMLLLQYGYL